jgi:hypothetical protein
MLVGLRARRRRRVEGAELIMMNRRILACCLCGVVSGGCSGAGSAGPGGADASSGSNAAGGSSFGDFGGQWTNSWTWSGQGGGTFPCALDFSGASITTCAGGAVDGEEQGSPLAGISFTYDGANTVSGSAQGWAEFSATR